MPKTKEHSVTLRNVVPKCHKNDEVYDYMSVSSSISTVCTIMKKSLVTGTVVNNCGRNWEQMF